MNTDVIYEPKGAALEYAPLALNIYKGCTHGCRYCYAPGSLRMSKAKYFAAANPKKNIVERVRKDAGKLAEAGDTREILISFIGDPYQPAEKDLGLTRQVIEILIEHSLAFTILTKGAELAMRDFDLLEDYPKARFGVTMAVHKQASGVLWEPNTDGIYSRFVALRAAHDFGIDTWVSMEPVIYPQEAMDILDGLAFWVDHIKIGKINHFPGHEKAVDWVKFRKEVTDYLVEWEIDYYIKESLRDAD